MTFLRQEL